MGRSAVRHNVINRGRDGMAKRIIPSPSIAEGVRWRNVVRSVTAAHHSASIRMHHGFDYVHKLILPVGV